jgi:hypothetical protein
MRRLMMNEIFFDRFQYEWACWMIDVIIVDENSFLRLLLSGEN